jgi:CRP-like cAMP-binding protein
MLVETREPIEHLPGVRRLSHGTNDAWEASAFGSLPQRSTTMLLQNSAERFLSAGEEVRPVFSTGGGASLPFCALVTSGFVRSYVSSEVREVTMRYLGPGDILGLPSVFAPMDAVRARAILDSVVIHFSPEIIRRVVREEPAAGLIACEALATAAAGSAELLSANVFRPMRQRVARHLLDLALRRDGRVVVAATPQDIADAIGTVREVASRTMKGMREEGLLIREGDVLVLPDLHAMHVVAGTPAGRRGALKSSSPGRHSRSA